ncbi:MAG: hypothetical protein NC343_06190 [Muribaculum sp.]|nr:hypothetical protein [Muribaculaceae bacterium]MCM1081323.1 hypothetical protein [Muribaculum sp.]
MKKLFAIIVYLISALSVKCYEPQQGDILFQGAGTSAFSQSIAASTTADTVAFRPIHVAFVLHGGTPENAYIIEAEPRLGVCITPFNDFIDGSAKSTDGKPMVMVKRVESPFFTNKEITKAISIALQHLGEPYDWVFLRDNGAVYCSELIQIAFNTSKGEKMFNYIPLNFKGPEGNILPFWKNIYDSRGLPVPQGEPGTSPVSIMENPALKEVYRFW